MNLCDKSARTQGRAEPAPPDFMQTFWSRLYGRPCSAPTLYVLAALAAAAGLGFALAIIALAAGCYDQCRTQSDEQYRYHERGTRNAECGVRTDPAGRHLPAFGQKDCGPTTNRSHAIRAAEAAAILPAKPPAQHAVTAPHSALCVSHCWRVTAYCPCPRCCGPRACGLTASGRPAAGCLVAAPPGIAFGTVVDVPGYGRAVVADRGGAIRGNRLDVLFPTHAQALAWGVRFLAIRFTAETAEDAEVSQK